MEYTPLGRLGRCLLHATNQAKITLCGEENAALPIKFEDARAALESEFVQLVPGTRDIEGRQARVSC